VEDIKTIADLLGRGLTDGERFKISVLKKILAELHAHPERFEDEEDADA
jgi:hypothetical protein